MLWKFTNVAYVGVHNVAYVNIHNVIGVMMLTNEGTSDGPCEGNQEPSVKIGSLGHVISC